MIGNHSLSEHNCTFSLISTGSKNARKINQTKNKTWEWDIADLEKLPTNFSINFFVRFMRTIKSRRFVTRTSTKNNKHKLYFQLLFLTYCIAVTQRWSIRKRFHRPFRKMTSSLITLSAASNYVNHILIKTRSQSLTEHWNIWRYLFNINLLFWKNSYAYAQLQSVLHSY